jgi:hypothetical protein
MATMKNATQNYRKNVAIGIAKCPATGKIYGVRVEEKSDKKWWATWAFPIKPEVAKREGYTTNQFPPDILYEKEYPGCPYCKKQENLAEITKPERKKQIPRICVSSPGCDDIGSILASDAIKIKYRNFADDHYNCDVLFLNCLTDDEVDPKELEKFVRNGGCLYASCYMDDVIDEAFPGIFSFAGHIGESSITLQTDVIDKELKEYIGIHPIKVFFNTAWAMLNSAKGDVLLRASSSNPSKYANKPIMVKVKYGNGLIFYTSFHNSAQASEREKALLQLLLLKQFGSNSNTSMLDASSDLGVDIDEIKAKFNFNW